MVEIYMEIIVVNVGWKERSDAKMMPRQRSSCLRTE